MHIVVDDLLTHYQQTGKGPLVLLLHGWGDSSATFRGITKMLEKDYTLLTLDLPGFGQTEIPPTVWTLDNYAQFIEHFLHKIKANPRAIAAHSNGGAVAIRGLAEGILDAKKLILIASAGIRNQQKVRRVFLKVMAKTGKVATFWLPKQHKKALQKRLYGAAGSDMLVVPHLEETFKMTVRQDVQRDAERLKLPVLLIYGDADKATPAMYGEIFQSLITDSRLEVVKDAEHFVHQDQPETVTQFIKDFLA